MALGILGTLAGLGQAPQGYMQTDDWLRRRQAQQLEMQQAQQQQQAMRAAGSALPSLAQQQQSQSAGMQPAVSGGAPDQMMPPQQAGGGNPGQPNGGMGGLAALSQVVPRLESGNRPYPPDSSAGAIGPWQVMPKTAGGYGVGVGQLRDPQVNAQVGQRYLGDMYKREGGNPQATLAAYQSGPKAGDQVRASGGDTSSLGPQGQQYVQRGMALTQEIQRKGAVLANIGVPQPAVRQSSQTAQQAAGAIDPSQWGRSQLTDIVNAVDKANPGLNPAVKMMAVTQLSKLMAPGDQQMFRAMMQQNQHMFQTGLEQLKEQFHAGQGDENRALHAADLGERTRHDQVMEGQGADRASKEKGWQIVQDQGKTYRINPNSGEKEEVDLSGAAHKMTSTPRSASAMGLSTFIDEFSAKNGRPPSSEDIRNYQAGMREATSEAGTVGSKAGNIETAANGADALIPLLKEKSHEINRTEYPTINKIILAYQEQTGDPAVVQYGEMINSMRYLYARAMSGTSQARVADLQNFDKIMNEAWSKGQIDAGLDQIRRSIGVEKGAVQKTRDEIRSGHASESDGTKYKVGQIVDTPKGKVRVTKVYPDQEPDVEPVK